MPQKVEEIIASHKPIFVPPGTPIRLAVEKMAAGNVGTVLVVKNGRLKGLFSERDLVRRVLAKDVDITTTPIDDIMTKVVATVGKNDDTKSCLELMLKMRCRSLPVVSFWKGTLGIVTLIDVLLDLTKEQEERQKKFKADSAGIAFEHHPNKNHLKDLAATQTIRTLTSQTDVMTAIKLMAAANIGSILIVDNAKLVGVISERDIVIRIYGSQLNPSKTKIAEIMTHQIGLVEVHTPIQDVLATMKKLACRTLPIEDQSKIIGVVSIINCLRWIYDEYQHDEMLHDSQSSAAQKASS